MGKTTKQTCYIGKCYIVKVTPGLMVQSCSIKQVYLICCQNRHQIATRSLSIHYKITTSLKKHYELLFTPLNYRSNILQQVKICQNQLNPFPITQKNQTISKLLGTSPYWGSLQHRALCLHLELPRSNATRDKNWDIEM